MGERVRRIQATWADGIGWIAYPDETMERASHAIVGESGTWLIDPLGGAGLDELLGAEPPVAGVVVCFDHHRRDAVELATAYDVAVHLPASLAYRGRRMDAPTASLEAFTADTGWEPFVIRDWIRWHEVGLSSPDGSTVRIPEAVGTARYFRAPGEQLGVHPTARLVPPRSALASITADRILVGHGEGVMDGGRVAITEALANARRRASGAFARASTCLPQLAIDQFRYP